MAELRDGMTIGIGGWASRRKPMSLVRAILRSPLRDLTIVSYGGPDIGLLCAAGKVRKAVYGFVSLDTIPLEPHFRLARQTRHDRGHGARRGDDAAGPAGGGLAGAVPAHPGRAGLGPADGHARDPHRALALPGPRRRRGRGAGGHAGARARRRADPHEPGRPGRQRPVPRPRPLHGRPHGHGGHQGRSCPPSRSCPPRSSLAEGSFHTLRISRLMVDGVVEAPNGAHFTECPPDYGRDEAFQKEYAATAVVARGVGRVPGASTSTSSIREPTYQRSRGGQRDDRIAAERDARAEVCVVAVAECFRGDGERLCNPSAPSP